MTRWDLVIFDCDGVLVDSEPLVNRLFVDMLAERGYDLDYDATLREFSGAAMTTRLETSRRRLGWPVPAGFTEEFDRRLQAAMERELQSVPGVRAVLDGLQGARCVVSNGAHHHMRFRLGRVDLLAAFEPHLFSANEVARPKPAPDVFLHAARAMGAPPSRCAVIEDSVTGVRAAVDAGMTVFGFARLADPDALRTAGARVFERMDELPDLLSE